MAGITSGVGLISGFPIQDTIDKLISLASQPKSLLTSRNQTAQSQQLALGKLGALALGVQTYTKSLASTDTFGKKQATSSNEQLLTATIAKGATVTNGSYNFVPVRTAQAQQLLSTGFASNTQPIGAGTFTFGFGGFVNKGIALDQLNGGAGVRGGQIKITDRSGATATIDLRYAQNIDDVLDAVNSQSTVNVQAVLDGDRIKLVDKTGLTASNLIVQDIGTGTTAADLGLGGINVATNSATGNDIVSLDSSLSLRGLNNGNGVSIRTGLPELEVSFADGSSPLQIELDGAVTLGDVIDKINAADPTRLHAQISADGDHLELTDLTSGSGTFAVTSPLGGSVAEELGLTGTASGGTITSGRLQAGLKTALLSALNGGQGLGQLGSLSLTDRSGASATVDLSSAETLDDVIRVINGSGLGITASVNDARNGIQLTDTTGSTASNLTVANADGTNTANKLQIASSTSSTKINGGALKLQSVSASTPLSEMNGGQGIYRNTMIFTDTNGSVGSVRLLDTKYQTVGDLIDGINGLGIGIKASINATGDGIQLTDTAGGNLKMSVRDAGSSGRAAKQLHISGESTTKDINGTPTEVIDGSNTLSVTLSSTDTLQDFVTKLNGLNAGLAASIISLGTGTNPYRLSITSQRTGSAGEFMIDTSGLNFSLNETAKGQDALLAAGTGSALSGLLVSSSSNTFENLLGGVSLTVNGASTSPVTLTVGAANNDLVTTVQKMVDSYNSLRTELDNQTDYNEDPNQRGVLFGSLAVLRLDTDFGNLLSGRINGAGTLTSIGDLGLSLNDKGKLSLDQSALKAKLESDPDAVKDFFTSDKTGFAVRLNNLIDQTANGDKSLLEAQKKSLQDRIDSNQKSIDLLTIRLAAQRTFLENQFNGMETALARLQSNQSALASLAQLASVVQSSGSSSSSSK